MITVYAYNCGAVGEGLYREMLPRVSGERRRKAERFLRREDAVRSVCGELIVRLLFAQKYSGCAGKEPEFTANAYEKPSIANAPDFHFNISHSGDWVVCAVGDSEIGVDIEKIEIAELAIANRFFSQSEIDALHREPPHARNGCFYRLWTAKESYVKCVGRGLSIPLNSFSIVGDRVVESGTQTDYVIWHYDIGVGYALATCCQHTDKADLVRLESLLSGD